MIAENAQLYENKSIVLCIGMVRPFENRILKSPVFECPVFGWLLYMTCDDACKSNHCPTVHSVILNIFNWCGSDYNFAAECRDRSQSCFLWSLKWKQEWIGNFVRNVNYEYASAFQYFLLLCTFHLGYNSSDAVCQACSLYCCMEPIKQLLHPPTFFISFKWVNNLMIKKYML